ncbi:MAG: hypothetical protein ACKVT0_17880, partial [Planctomycetaceae bacterium]
NSPRRDVRTTSRAEEAHISQVHTTDDETPEAFPELDQAKEINARPIGNSTLPSKRPRRSAVDDIDIEAE